MKRIASSLGGAARPGLGAEQRRGLPLRRIPNFSRAPSSPDERTQATEGAHHKSPPPTRSPSAFGGRCLSDEDFGLLALLGAISVGGLVILAALDVVCFVARTAQEIPQ